MMIIRAALVAAVALGFVAAPLAADAQPAGKVPRMILKEVVPKISRVAVLHNPANPGNAPEVRHAQDAARALGVRLQILGARGPGEIDNAFAAMTHERASAVIVLVDAVLQNNRA